MGATYPNGGLITETNAQYYAGQQGFPAVTGAIGGSITLKCNFQKQIISGFFFWDGNINVINGF